MCILYSSFQVSIADRGRTGKRGSVADDGYSPATQWVKQWVCLGFDPPLLNSIGQHFSSSLYNFFIFRFREEKRTLFSEETKV